MLCTGSPPCRLPVPFSPITSGRQGKGCVTIALLPLASPRVTERCPAMREEHHCGGQAREKSPAFCHFVEDTLSIMNSGLPAQGYQSSVSRWNCSDTPPTHSQATLYREWQAAPQVPVSRQLHWGGLLPAFHRSSNCTCQPDDRANAQICGDCI